jgi:hypothetical protein
MTVSSCVYVRLNAGHKQETDYWLGLCAVRGGQWLFCGEALPQ